MQQDLKFIHLQPYFKPVLWANTNLQNRFKTAKPIGEAWLISTLPNCEATVINKQYYGITLTTLFVNHPSLFGYYPYPYPTLTKIIDAKLPLSIQVHPDDAFARQYHCYGKAEGWYVLKSGCDPFVLGTTIQSKQQLLTALKTNQIKQHLITKQLSPGSFVYIAPGQIHAIPANTMVYEIQQASDLTFRLYDYQRTDHRGKLRELHWKEGLEVVNPHLVPAVITNQPQLINNQYFFLTKVVCQTTTFQTYYLQKPCYFAEITVVSGKGSIDHIPVEFGDALLLTSGHNQMLINGNFTMLINLIL